MMFYRGYVELGWTFPLTEVATVPRVDICGARRIFDSVNILVSY